MLATGEGGPTYVRNTPCLANRVVKLDSKRRCMTIGPGLALAPGPMLALLGSLGLSAYVGPPRTRRPEVSTGDSGTQPVVPAARIEGSKELRSRAIPTFTCAIGQPGYDAACRIFWSSQETSTRAAFGPT